MTVAATAEATNRIAKATRLATVLIQAGCTPYRCTIMREQHWFLAVLAVHDLDRQAGKPYKPLRFPSSDTKKLVCDLIAAQQTRRRKTV